MKEEKYLGDNRPKKYGWCPGNYTCNCFQCKKDFIGDKRSVECADCAYGYNPSRIADYHTNKLNERVDSALENLRELLEEE